MSIEYITTQFKRHFPYAHSIDVAYIDDETIHVTINQILVYTMEVGSDDDQYDFSNVTGHHIMFPIQPDDDDEPVLHDDERPTLDELRDNKPRVVTELDENGAVVNYADWLDVCRLPLLQQNASDGHRVTSAKALQIAVDVIRYVIDDTQPQIWSVHDMKLALGAIAGIRAQQGITGPDADALGQPDGIYLTHYMDIVIYG